MLAPLHEFNWQTSGKKRTYLRGKFYFPSFSIRLKTITKFGPFLLLFLCKFHFRLLIPNCIFSGVGVKPKSVLCLYCEYPISAWENQSNISLRPLTSITAHPTFAVIHLFPDSIQAQMDFPHCLSP